MTNALRSIVAAELLSRPKDPRQWRDARDGNGKPIVPVDLPVRLIKATMKRGRPKFALADSYRDAWEEAVASAYLNLSVDGSFDLQPPNDVLADLVKKLEAAEAALIATHVRGEWLVDLPYRLRFAIESLQRIPRRKAGERRDGTKRLQVAWLLRLYEEGFACRPSSAADSPAMRFIREFWSIARERPSMTPEGRKKLGSDDAAVRVAGRLIERTKVAENRTNSAAKATASRRK